MLTTLFLSDETENAASVLERAKGLFLASTEIHQTSRAWIGIAKASFALDCVDDTEEALNQANLVNNRDFEVWLELTRFYISQDKLFDATQAIAEAIKLGLSDPDILRYEFLIYSI